MTSDIPAFKIIDNLYFVGTYEASSHAIDTGEGIILIDVGYDRTAPVVIAGLESMGYSVEDVKYILLSHGHSDHSDGVLQIVEKSNAKVFMFEEDNRYLKGFTPTNYLNDGNVIRLGSVEIEVMHTPGHTGGTASFFFMVKEGGKTYRVGMFGGAGTKQLSKPFLDGFNLPYYQRKQFFDSIDRLEKEHVDVFIGNHSWQNKTKEKREILHTCDTNPFINEWEWGEFLQTTREKLWKLIRAESKALFVNYAHRGASEYMPENTLSSFLEGVRMNANGIETDVRITKDRVAVLFHDNNLARVTGLENETRAIESYTYEEIRAFDIKKGKNIDKILTLKEFMESFACKDLTFAIELKGEGVEEITANLLRAYNMQNKCVVTSFSYDYLKKFKEYAPEFRVGFLCKDVNEKLIKDLHELGADEICPLASQLNTNLVDEYHRQGFRVRAWGVKNVELMKQVYNAGVDGMTVNFPDKLNDFLISQTKE